MYSGGFSFDCFFFFFFKQKTAYEMRISDWSSDVCSSDLVESDRTPISAPQPTVDRTGDLVKISASGPIATSRYCDHMPSSISACLSVAASPLPGTTDRIDRKSTRLNSSH